MSKTKKDEIVNNSFEDTPDGPWASCDECETLMNYSQQLDKFRCSCCGKEIYADDYEEYYDDKNMPYGCRACGGPYPQCMTSCKMFDD